MKSAVHVGIPLISAAFHRPFEKKSIQFGSSSLAPLTEIQSPSAGLSVMKQVRFGFVPVALVPAVVGSATTASPSASMTAVCAKRFRDPAGPAGPVAPVGPLGPCGPAGPTGPTGPTSPLHAARRIRIASVVNARLIGSSPWMKLAMLSSATKVALRHGVSQHERYSAFSSGLISRYLPSVGWSVD